MELKGSWKAVKAQTRDEDGNVVFIDMAEAMEKGMIDPMSARSLYVFSDDNKLRRAMPIPEGTPKDEIDKAVSTGRFTLYNDMLVTGVHDLKEEDGKVFFDASAGKGEPHFVEITEAPDGMIDVFLYRLARV